MYFTDKKQCFLKRKYLFMGVLCQIYINNKILDEFCQTGLSGSKVLKIVSQTSDWSKEKSAWQPTNQINGTEVLILQKSFIIFTNALYHLPF